MPSPGPAEAEEAAGDAAGDVAPVGAVAAADECANSCVGSAAGGTSGRLSADAAGTLMVPTMVPTRTPGLAGAPMVRVISLDDPPLPLQGFLPLRASQGLGAGRSGSSVEAEPPPSRANPALAPAATSSAVPGLLSGSHARTSAAFTVTSCTASTAGRYENVPKKRRQRTCQQPGCGDELCPGRSRKARCWTLPGNPRPSATSGALPASPPPQPEARGAGSRSAPPSGTGR